ncbi:MAG TPA: glycoside hydrolase family 3 C-terminal domain-containing protein [Micromonosporaceae bacterium]|nr:glycoside hydrolase family 3 C-terminal domain-containing protein [Micromonosporaceae bacterium]
MSTNHTDPEPTEHNAVESAIDVALARLDLPTKVSILTGQDSWTLPAVPAIGLRSIVMSDGPIGVRGTTWTPDDPSIALPSPTALAATWDRDLARRTGRLLGQEARRKGVHLLLAPTVNLHRSPLGGRHFECYSEDPLLTGVIGTEYVTGVQEQGVGTTVKHFVANDYETERMTASSNVDERTLREMYLAPFESILRDANAWGVMSAYNSVNGVSMTEHEPLQVGLLRREWGFDGVVVSDWTAARDMVGDAHGGLDIAMPRAFNPWGDRLVDAVRAGHVAEELIDEKVRRVLRFAARVGAWDAASSRSSTDPANERIDGVALAREIAARSFVLASNRDGLLPLAASELSSIALIGLGAHEARVLGGGSATVFPAHVVSPLEGLETALDGRVSVTYAPGVDPRTRLPAAAAPHWTGLTATFRDADGATLAAVPMATGRGWWMGLPEGVDPERLASVEIAGRLTAQRGGTHHLSARGIGEFKLTVTDADGERTLFEDAMWPDASDIAVAFLAPPETRLPVELGAGDSVHVSLRQNVYLPEGLATVSLTLGHGEPIAPNDELLDEAARLAAASDVAVVMVGTTNEVESEGFDRTTLALPGRQDELVRRVLAANPRTVVVVNAGSPVEMPWADDVAAVLLTWFPGQEAGHALADVLLGAAEPGGRLPTTWPVRETDCPILATAPVNGVVAYDEGVFIGYRGWDRGDVAPRYPFGHGTGYTTWAYESIAVDRGTVTVTVRNTGDRPGREVVQCYVAPVEPDNARPRRWLAGFAVATAAPGATVTVTIDVPDRVFQIWDGGWRTVDGEYEVAAAHSIEDWRLVTKTSIG